MARECFKLVAPQYQDFKFFRTLVKVYIQAALRDTPDAAKRANKLQQLHGVVQSKATNYQDSPQLLLLMARVQHELGKARYAVYC